MAPFEPTRCRGAGRQDAIEETAAEWLARRDAGFAEEERAAFERWIAADASHANAVRDLETAWTAINQPRLAARSELVLRELALRDRNRRVRRRRTLGGFAAVGLAAAAAIMLGVRPETVETAPPRAVASSISPRPERQTLPDGSVVEFNTGTEIAVEYSPVQRRVRLLRGESHFAVTKDPQRPFVVTAGNVSVRAVGTEFVVRYATRGIDVLVTEGRVAVAHVPVTAESTAGTVETEAVFVDAGGTVSMPSEISSGESPQVSPVTGAQMAAALAWRGNRVEFTGTALSDAIAMFNRQNTVQLSLAQRSLAGLRVSGIFWSDDPEGFARLLKGSMGIRMERRSDTEIALHAAP